MSITLTYTYDHRNRLIRVTSQSYDTANSEYLHVQIVEYAYDVNNILIRKLVDTDSNDSFDEKVLFISEGSQTALQLEDTNLADTASDTITHHYLWTPGIQDKLLADTSSSETLWTLTDHLGSVRDVLQLTPIGIANISHIVYDSYGNITSGTNPILFGYTGKLFDTSTNLQNNINRWYDPTIGRWLTVDPISFAAGDTNLYRYVGNRTTLFTDPSGLNMMRLVSQYSGYRPPDYVSEKLRERYQAYSPEEKVQYHIRLIQRRTDENRANIREESQVPSRYQPYEVAPLPNSTLGAAGYGALTGFCRCGQAMWGPFRYTGVTGLIGIEGRLRQSDVALDAMRQHAGVEKGTWSGFAMDCSAEVYAASTCCVLLTPSGGGTGAAGSRFGPKVIDQAADLIMKDPRKIEHIFAAKHKLGPLVQQLGGQEKAIRAVLNAANGKLPASGLFENIPVIVGGQTILIRGSVVNGIPRIGTMFIP